MSTISFRSSFLLSAIFLVLHFGHEVAADGTVATAKREALEIIIGGGSEPPPDEPPCPLVFENKRLENVYNVLQIFKSQITCDPKGYTDTWNGVEVCNYMGISCAKQFPGTNERAVYGYDFNEAGFYSPNLNLSGLLDQLPDTVYFHANSNNFTSSVPFSISKFVYFNELDLSNNKISGEFPKTVLASKNLTFIDLRFNLLHGAVPTELFDMDVDVIFINNNNFGQCLPDNFGSTRAVYITVSSNNFIGPIPSSVGNAPRLREVLFLNNSFSGCLPGEIGRLSNTTVFDVSINKLTGPIPQSFTCLGKMQYLNLSQNLFYGEIPEQVCKLPNLIKLTLSANYFNWIGPECVELIKRGVLDVKMNCISGLPYQRFPYECHVFYSKPRYCSNAESLSYIPCGEHYESWEKTLDPSPPVTYKALTPNNS